MNHRILKQLLISALLLFVLSGCGLFGGEEEAPAQPPEEQPEETVVELPTPTPLPVEAPPDDVVSLLNEPQTLAESTAEAAPQAVQMPRFSVGAYSFVPPAGWEIVEMGGDVLLVRQVGDDPFTGPQNNLPYIYMHTTPAENTPTTAALLEILDKGLLANLAGVQTTEPPQGIIIDGVKGVWQFAEGVSDAGRYRAYLMAIPAGRNTTLHTVVWGPADAWGAVSPSMAKVLETMRFPAAPLSPDAASGAEG